MKKPNVTLAVIAGAIVLLLGHFSLQERSGTTPAREHPLPSRSSSQSRAEKSTFRAERVKLTAHKRHLRAAVESSDWALQDAAIEIHLPAWVLEDAPSAAAFVLKITSPIPRDKALRMLAQKWGALDPETATAWALSLPDVSERSRTLTDACLGLAEKQPEAAVKLATTHQLHENGILDNLVQQWATADPAGALAWAAGFPAGDERDCLLQRVALVQAKNAPETAAALVVSEMPPGPAQTEAVMAVLHQWMQHDPQAAAAWVDLFPEGEIRARALAEVHGLAVAP